MTNNARIQTFIDTLVKVLQDVVDSRNILFHERLRGNLEAAWTDIKNNSLVGIKDGIASADDKKLRDAGLTGPQLNLKLQGFDSAYEDLTKMGGIRRLKRVFAWANLILGSLAAVVPAVELLKEYKESAEIGIKEAEES